MKYLKNSFRIIFIAYFISNAVVSPAVASQEILQTISSSITKESLQNYAAFAASCGAGLAYFSVAITFSIFMHELGHAYFQKKYYETPVHITIGEPFLGFNKPLLEFMFYENKVTLYPFPLGGKSTPLPKTPTLYFISEKPIEGAITITPKQKITIDAAGPIIGALSDYLLMGILNFICARAHQQSYSNALLIALKSPFVLPKFDAAPPLLSPQGHSPFGSFIQKINQCIRTLYKKHIITFANTSHTISLLVNLINLLPYTSGSDGERIARRLGLDSKKSDLIVDFVLPLLFSLFCTKYVIAVNSKKYGSTTACLTKFFQMYLLQMLTMRIITHKESIHNFFSDTKKTLEQVTNRIVHQGLRKILNKLNPKLWWRRKLDAITVE